MSPEIDALLSELGASLAPAQRRAFEAAAQAALAATHCSGAGAAFRVLAPLQRAFWDPPADARTTNGARHHRITKLQSEPPIGSDDPRVGGRDRRRLAG